MNPVVNTGAVVEAAASAPAGKAAFNVIQMDNTMVILTWVCFFITAFVLYKIAWKPILAALEKREGDIQRALDSAEAAKKIAAESEQRGQALIAEADAKAREIVDQARQAAETAGAAIRAKAQEEARGFLDGARREIEEARLKAEAALRRESASLAITLAGRLVRENLDDAKNRALADKLIEEQ